jgi:serine/threonine protein kinase
LTRYQILQFALQLAQALDQLHKAGLVHGGIEYSALYFKTPGQLVLKPVNLQRVIPMLRPMTFKSLERVQKRYLAPEASEGLTPATDFYALGVLLFQLICGHAPVDTTDTKLLEEWLFIGENQDLEYFFSQLLAVDSAQRIQSLDQFTEALQQCGIDLLELASRISKNTYVQHHKANDGVAASRSSTKWIVLTAGLAVTALSGALILSPSPDEARQMSEPQDRSEAVASTDTTNVKINPVEPLPVATLAKKEPDNTSPTVENLYQQALIQMESSPEDALLNLNDVLKHKPGHIASLKLKHQIEKELMVRSLIDTAEQQIMEEKLLKPSGDNAYETYQALAQKLSSDDERVRSGFTHIAAAYHSLAENLFEKELLDKALEYADLGLSVKDNYPPLLELRITINEQQKVLQDKLKLAQLEKQRSREKQIQLKKQLRKKEQLELEKKQAAVEMKQRQEEQAKKVEQQTVEQEMQALKQDEVDALLLSASDHLNKGRLTLKNVFAAHLNYDELQKLDSSSQRVVRLKNALINAYALLAKRQSNEKLYKLAIQAIEQGVKMHPQDKKQLQIKSQLSFSTF